jgi:hypothetical protein
MASNQYLQDYNSSPSTKSYSLAEYFYNQNGLPRRKELVPFFIELVDFSGRNVPLDLGDGVMIKGLRLMINPATCNMNMSKIVNRTQTMVSWVEEHWGEDLDTISFQGSTASFIYGARTMTAFEGKARLKETEYKESFDTAMGLSPITDKFIRKPMEGLTVQSRRDTLAYQEFKIIAQQISGTNGAEFDSQGFVKAKKYIQLSYDYAIFRGYIESLDITEDASTPFRFTYTLTFKSEKTIFMYMR